VATLRKYCKAYNLSGIHPQSSREDLAEAVSRHWNSVVRLRAAAGGACSLGPACTARTCPPPPS
jgi:hypothetical protein